MAFAREESQASLALSLQKHVKFWRLHLSMLPTPYTKADDQRFVHFANARMTLAYFCLSALDLLGQLDTVTTEKEREEYIDWIYSQQLCEWSDSYTSAIPRGRVPWISGSWRRTFSLLMHGRVILP